MAHTSERRLERALLFSWLIHAVAMLAMVALLVPGLPGGGPGLDQRMAYVGAHPWLWRLGWLPWQLTALSDLLISIALIRAGWGRKAAAWLGLIFTIAAILPEQTGEFLFVLRGPAMAQAGNLAAYGVFEDRLFHLTSAYGAFFYAIAAVFWSWSFASAGTWRRWMTPFSAVLWMLFAYISGVLLLPEGWRPSPSFVAAGNAVGFIFLMIWFTVVTELVLRRSRPDGPHGRQAPWVHPKRLCLGRLVGNLLANSRLVRAFCEMLPVMSMLSDITDVIYVNYIVPAERVESLVPEGLELQRIGPGARYALFTFLTFRHGHFGPRFLGPLRRLLPSPVQTNWRIYVRDPRTGKDGIYFVTNAIDSTVHALGARLLSEGMPMHVLHRADVRHLPDGEFHLVLDPGDGSAPAAEARLRHLDMRHDEGWASAWPTEGPWREAFASYADMLAHCVPQDRALSSQPWLNRVTSQEIILDIPLEACEPLEGTVQSPSAAAIVGDARAFCFRVAQVNFRFEREEHHAWMAGGVGGMPEESRPGRARRGA